MAPKRSASEKWKSFFTRPFRRASSTKGRPTTYDPDPDPFLSQGYVRAQDLQRLQDVRDKNRPANVPSKPWSSQDPRRSNRPFGERPNTGFQAGMDGKRAALMGDPTTHSRGRREQGTTPYPIAPPTRAHVGDARALRREQEPSWPLPISAPLARANLADSFHDEPTRDRQPIRTVPTHRVELNPPPERRSVQVQFSTPSPVQVRFSPPSPALSTSSHTTRWDDFAGPPPPPPKNPPALTRRGAIRKPNPPPWEDFASPPPPPPQNPPALTCRGAIRKPIPTPISTRQPAAPPPAPLPLCRLCQTRPVSGPGSTHCAYCTSVAFYPDNYPRASTYPSRTPVLGPPPVAHLKDSAYTKSQRTQAQAQPQGRAPSRTQSQSQSQRSYIQPQPPAPAPPIQKNPFRTQSTRNPQRYQHQHLAPSSTSPVDESHIHPALRSSSQRFPASPDPSLQSFDPGDNWIRAGQEQGRRGAVSGDQEEERRGLWGLPLYRSDM